MSRRKIIGRISESKMRFEWTIPNFSSLVELPFEGRYISHDFQFSRIYWQLELFPNRRLPNKEWIEVGLYRDLDHGALQVKVALGICKPDGTDAEACNRSVNIASDQKFWGRAPLVRKRDLRRHRTELMESDVLTIFCYLKREKNDGEEKRLIEKEEKLLDEKSCKLFCQHLGEMLATGEDCDITFRVWGRDFPAHSFILRARSPVFNGMLSHDMAEKNSGVVTVDDCDPAAFADFLQFVYTGSVDVLSMDNAVSLFCAAEKYDIESLKDQCREFLQGNLSTSVVCDVVRIAALHKETRLLDIATRFLADHLSEILAGESWMDFLREDPDQANMIFRESIKILLERKKD